LKAFCWLVWQGSAELIDALDVALDTKSHMFAFRREPNIEAHDLAMQLNSEVREVFSSLLC
jgi:hypothetical protein